jgi:hypothetical protein
VFIKGSVTPSLALTQLTDKVYDTCSAQGRRIERIFTTVANVTTRYVDAMAFYTCGAPFNALPVKNPDEALPSLP